MKATLHFLSERVSRLLILEALTAPSGGFGRRYRVAGKRLPHPSVERKWDDASVQTATLSAAWSFGLDRGQRFARMTTSDAANGKSRNIGSGIIDGGRSETANGQ